MADIEELLHRRPDLSTFVVHFTRDQGDTRARENLLDILTEGHLQARNVFGMASKVQIRQVKKTQKVVCFTETPLEHAWMMCQPIRGRQVAFDGYGLAFTKTFARRNAVNPIWYLDITPGHDWLTTPVEELLDQVMRAFEDKEIDADELAQSPIFGLTPFLEQMGPMKDPAKRKEFWWEREWRHVGDLRFAPDEVVVAFAPEADHEELRAELLDHAARLSTEGEEDYDPEFARQLRRLANRRLVDATWGLEHMIGTLAGVEDLGPFPNR